ncbi:MAG: hypothetical protein FJ096_21750 [Deltaproteobacteria bacterium]|nr:hypothetical protein [Deltaproteobacteria bacterium]
MTAPAPPSSPLERSMREGTNVLSVLLYLLAGVLAVAMILVWTLDEASNSFDRGWMLCGLSLTMAALGSGLQRAMNRPAPPAPSPIEPASTYRFRRLRRGPAWTDWLVPLVPVLIVLPLFLLALDKRPPLEALGGALFLLAVLELLVLPALVVARREWV